MDDQTLQNIKERTNAKLRYAKIYLDELKSLGIIGGSDSDRAHQESFIYHLLGAKAAFIVELNYYYQTNLSTDDLTAGKLRNALKVIGKRSPELSKLYLLESDENSWISHAKEIRDHATHVSNVSRAYHLGGENDQKVFLKNPKTSKQIEQHFVDLFSEWLELMTRLLDNLRFSALQNNSLN